MGDKGRLVLDGDEKASSNIYEEVASCRIVLLGTNPNNSDKGDNADRNGTILLSLLSALSQLQQNVKSNVIDIYNYYVSLY